MATRFEFVLYGRSEIALRAAGEEAIETIERLEDQLSLYRPTSEIARLNALAARESVRVSPTLFALLAHARSLHEETNGAFDITVAPLVRCWGFMGGNRRIPIPTPEELAEARSKVGMELLQLTPQDFTVRFAREGVMLDLGAIGKGYAIDRAAEVLREAGIESALLHGGTSSAYAIGQPPEAESWRIAVEDPRVSRDSPLASLATVPLKDEAISVSTLSEKYFEVEGKTFGHVLDPRTGAPTTAGLLAAVVLPSATETDALSTALLTSGIEGHERIAKLRPGMRTLLVTSAGVQSTGISG
jgi:thiamine biosynthesis lipoprotein